MQVEVSTYKALVVRRRKGGCESILAVLGLHRSFSFPQAICASCLPRVS